MAAASVADVRRIAPELASVSDIDVEAFLADAALELSECVWGKLYPRAQATLAAHLTTCANPGLAEPAGAIASESVGGVSRSYAVAAPVASEWATTRHGVELQRLMRLLGPFALVL